jgi:flagellar M-ring protein FliF
LALGVPGTRSNVTDPATQNDQPTNQSSRQSETINYEISKVTSKVVAPSGDVKRLSVAVLVDGTYQPGENEGETTFVPRPEAELEKYREIVKGAVGYDESRGDRLEIVNVPFEVPDQSEEQLFAVEAERGFWLEIGRYGAYAFLGLLVCFFIVRPVMKWLTAVPELMETTLPRTVQELEAEMEAPAGWPSGSLDGQQGPAGMSPARIGSQQMRQHVTQLVIDEPERTAEILRLWLRT